MNREETQSEDAMPFPTSAILTLRQSTTRYTLPHDLAPLTSTQARLKGRSVLTPAIDLDAYRFRAVVDWIEIECHFASVTQLRHVQTVLREYLDRNSFVKPLQAGDGQTFSRCKIKVQEPASLALVATICEALADRYGQVTAPVVKQIEMSVDAYPRDQKDATRALLLGAMQRTFWTDRDIWKNQHDRPRINADKLKQVTAKKKKRNMPYLAPKPSEKRDALSPANPQAFLAPFINSTMYVGARHAVIFHRIMDKVIDQQHQSGRFQKLTDAEKRVRIEVCLADWELEKVGITDVASLPTFRFTSLQKRFFQFKLPTFAVTKSATARQAGMNHLEAMRAQTYLTSGILALGLFDRTMDLRRMKLWKKHAPRIAKLGRPMPKRPGDDRLAAPTISWAEMNRKVNVAFQKLDEREAIAWRQREGVKV